MAASDLGVTTSSGWEDAAYHMTNNELLAASKIRAALGKAIDQVGKYEFEGTPRCFVAVLVSPRRVIVRSVPQCE